MQHELISLNARRAELEEVELEVMLRADAIKERIKDLSRKEAEEQGYPEICTRSHFWSLRWPDRSGSIEQRNPKERQQR